MVRLFFIGKRKSIFFALKIKKAALCAACVCFAAAAAICAVKFASSKAAFATPMANKVIIIDPGHGGADAGASANGAVEKELNLEIAKILQKYMEEGGAEAILTRTEDTNTADPNRPRGVTQKSSDLRERKEDAARFKADLFISIHMNKFEQPQYRGAQVFYSSDSDESKLLGETLQQAIKEVMSDGNNRAAKPSGGHIFVLKNTDVPSALIECGFLSNPDEAENLKTPEYRRRMAWGIYVGVMRFFSAMPQ